MGEVIDDGTTPAPARLLARRSEGLHAITYYSREMGDPTVDGYRGWWHAYFGCRPAPLGPVPAAVVTAVFYNFAPRMVARAVPGVWSIQSPEEALALRQRRVEAALTRIFGPGPGATLADHTLDVGPAAVALRRAIEDCPAAGRPLYAAYTALPWPDDDLQALWHGSTLVREHRFDGHTLALGSAGVDGVACHVLMSGMGRGNRPTIQAIRGWNDDEWDGAEDELRSRGWLDADGELTERGRQARLDIETRTDELGREPVRRLGDEGLRIVFDTLDPLVDHLRTTGEVSGSWPPPHLMRPARG
ncbi:MAG: hypothetical protein ACFCVK_02525 [Acidimicrobiales bacterium]